MSQVYKKRPDLILLFVAAALLSVGLLMVFSASPTWAMRVGDSYYYVKRHLAALAVGIAGMYLGYRMDLPVLSQRCNQIFGAAVILLMIVLVPGIGMGIGGANRWISMGFFSFQPGELAKVALIIFLAGRFSADTLSKPLVPLLCSAACALLVVMEPDIGTAVIICIITFAMFYFEIIHCGCNINSKNRSSSRFA